MRSSILSPFTLFISVALLFGTTTTAFALPDKEKFINAGQNEHIDPSQSPLYDKQFTQITFKEGLNLDEMKILNEVAPIFESRNRDKAPKLYLANKEEKGQKIIAGTTIKDTQNKIKQMQNSGKVSRVALNHDPQDKSVQTIKFLNGELDSLSIDEKQKIRQNIQKVKKKQGDIATNARVSFTQESVNKNIKEISSKANREMMDILYPSKKRVNKLNQKIKKERRQIYDYEQKKEQNKSQLRRTWESTSSFFADVANAYTTHNSSEHLVMYANYNLNKNIDLIGNNESPNSQLQIYGRNNSDAQNFYFFDGAQGSTIKPHKNSNLCLEVAGGNYYDGARIQLNYCNGDIAQLWETWPDRTIRAAGAKWLCLDAKNGLKTGHKIQGWTCNDNGNQKFLVGKNDFTDYYIGRYIRIHAQDTYDLSNAPGHALISVGKRDLNNKSCWATNSFGFWPGPGNPYHGRYDTNMQNTDGKTNNIQTGNAVHVDRTEDWNEAIGQSSDYRKRDLNIGKRMYDEIKYMNGYYGWYKDFWEEEVKSYSIPQGQYCSIYARDIWWKYTGGNNGGEWMKAATPHDIYNAIWWFNEEEGPQSQCGVGY